MGFKGPRKITLALPSMTPEAKFKPYQPTKEDDTLAVQMLTNPKPLLMLHNKSPQWSEGNILVFCGPPPPPQKKKTYSFFPFSQRPSRLCSTLVAASPRPRSKISRSSIRKIVCFFNSFFSLKNIVIL